MKKPEKQEVDREKLPEFVFTPLVEFTWFRGDALVGRYIPGQDYYCTRQPRHDELREKCVEWEKNGQIKITMLAAGQHFVTVKLN